MERLPPYNAEAEEAVLGSLLIGQGDVLHEVEPILQPSDFFKEKGGWIYQAVLNLNKRESAIDFVTICDELEQMGKLDQAGGPAYVMSLINAVPTSLHAEHYAKIVYEHSVRRQLVQVAQDIVTLAYGNGTEGVEDLLAKAEQKLAKVGQRLRPKVYTVEDVLSGFWDELFEPTGKVAKRIFTGLLGIDGPLLGIESGRFWTMAAVPGTGKTATVLNIVRGAIKNNKGEIAVLYFHPEQPREEITQLLWCSGTTNVPPIRLKAMMTPKERRQEFVKAEAFINGSTQTRGIGQMKAEYLAADPTPEEIEALAQSQAEIDGVPIILEDPAGQNIHQVLATIRRVRYKLPNHVFLLVVFDGAHLIPGMGEGNRTQELAAITRNLKIAAQKLVTADGQAAGAIIANTQLNREIFQNVANRVYLMKHLKDSGSWEADSDVIIFIDRGSVFSNNGNETKQWDPFKIIVAKNRQTSKLFTAYFVMNTSTMMVRGRDLT